MFVVDEMGRHLPPIKPNAFKRPCAVNVRFHLKPRPCSKYQHDIFDGPGELLNQVISR